MAYWLVKSEVDTYGIDDLKRDKKTEWTGVRSFAARLHLRAMNVGDEVLYYHSMSKDNGVVGLAKVSKKAFPDPTAEDGDWSAVEIKFVKKFTKPLLLAQIKEMPELKEMKLLKIGRLSVSPVTESEFKAIMEKVNN